MLHHIDCLEFMRGMVERGEKVDAIITDPPYLYLNHKLDRPFNEREFFELASKITDKIIFFGRGDSFYRWNLLCAEFGLEFKEEVVWDKAKTSCGTIPLLRRHETIGVRIKKDQKLNRVKIDSIKNALQEEDFLRLFKKLKVVAGQIQHKAVRTYLERGEKILRRCKNGRHCVTHSKFARKGNKAVEALDSIVNGENLTSIIVDLRTEKGEHPTQKPINLLRKLVLLISNKGDTIFDPFMGSGSTGVASLIEGRKFIGCEIDAEYFEIAKRRVGETDKALRQSLFYGID